MAAGDCRARVVALLIAAGRSAADAAREAGISERTVHRLLKNPRFIDRVRKVQAQTRECVVARLTDACTEAVATLRSLLDPGVAATARVSAARAIMEHAAKLTTMLELETRIAALESQRSSSHAAESAKTCRNT